jgi:hypothetical protein
MSKNDWQAGDRREDARLKREAWIIGGLMALGLILTALSFIPQG